MTISSPNLKWQKIMTINILVWNYKNWFKKILPNKPYILFPKTNNIKEPMLITVLNRNISITEGSNIGVACGFDKIWWEMEIEEYQSRGSYLAEWSGFRMANGKYYTSGESIMLQHQWKSYCFLLLVIHQDISNPNRRYYNVFVRYC